MRQQRLQRKPAKRVARTDAAPTGTRTPERPSTSEADATIRRIDEALGAGFSGSRSTR